MFFDFDYHTVPVDLMLAGRERRRTTKACAAASLIRGMRSLMIATVLWSFTGSRSVLAKRLRLPSNSRSTNEAIRFKNEPTSHEGFLPSTAGRRSLETAPGTSVHSCAPTLPMDVLRRTTPPVKSSPGQRRRAETGLVVPRVGEEPTPHGRRRSWRRPMMSAVQRWSMRRYRCRTPRRPG